MGSKILAWDGEFGSIMRGFMVTVIPVSVGYSHHPNGLSSKTDEKPGAAGNSGEVSCRILNLHGSNLSVFMGNPRRLKHPLSILVLGADPNSESPPLDPHGRATRYRQ